MGGLKKIIGIFNFSNFTTLLISFFLAAVSFVDAILYFTKKSITGNVRIEGIIVGGLCFLIIILRWKKLNTVYRILAIVILLFASFSIYWCAEWLYRH